MPLDAIILAGGLGTRLRGVVNDVPKPMADIGGRPFLAYLLDFFSAQGASRILLSVGYKKEVIRNYFGDRHLDMDIACIEEDTPLGTGGALRKALQHARGDTVVAANGDSFLALNLRDMLRLHRERGSSLTIAVRPVQDSARYGSLLIRGGRAVGFREKASGGKGYINGGVYALERRLLLELLADYPVPFSFETDFLHKNIVKLNTSVFMTNDYFIDIGIPEDYRRAQKMLASKVRERL